MIRMNIDSFEIDEKVMNGNITLSIKFYKKNKEVRKMYIYHKEDYSYFDNKYDNIDYRYEDENEDEEDTDDEYEDNMDISVYKRLYDLMNSKKETDLIYDFINNAYLKLQQLVQFNHTITKLAWLDKDYKSLAPIFYDTRVDLLNNFLNTMSSYGIDEEEDSQNYYDMMANLFSDIYQVKVVAKEEFLYADYSELIKKIKRDPLITDVSFKLLAGSLYFKDDIDKVPSYFAKIKVNAGPPLSGITYQQVSLHPLGLEAKESMLTEYPYSEVFKGKETTLFLNNLTRDIHKLCSDLNKADYNDLMGIAMEMELVTMPELIGLQRGQIQITKADLCKRIKMMLQIQNEDVTKLLEDIESLSIDDISGLGPVTKKMRLY